MAELQKKRNELQDAGTAQGEIADLKKVLAEKKQSVEQLEKLAAQRLVELESEEDCQAAVYNCQILDDAVKNAKGLIEDLARKLKDVLDICAPVTGEPRTLEDRVATALDDCQGVFRERLEFYLTDILAGVKSTRPELSSSQFITPPPIDPNDPGTPALVNEAETTAKAIVARLSLFPKP